MGSTLTLAYYLDGELFVAHAGDSRAYLLRDRKLHRLTHDHTLTAELVRRDFPEVPWHTFAGWAQEQDWSVLDQS